MWYEGRPYKTILTGVFFAPEGRYRAILFTVTDVGFIQSPNRDLDKKKVEDWLRQGFKVLPNRILEEPVSPDTHCTALVYEFEARGYNEKSHLVRSRLLGRDHLQMAGLRSLLSF